MCGICGIVNFNGSPIDPTRLVMMRERMAHRGPDGFGAVLLSTKRKDKAENFIEFKNIQQLSDLKFNFSSFDVGLAHQRLAIIDLSEAAHQPMCNDQRTLWIIYNGEIYNYENLRKELSVLGHKFKSNSDTEVIIHAFEEWGEDCLRKLNGMFAFAIWDTQKKRLFAARDRLGIKPFYYHALGKSLIFSSEIKSILASNLVKAEPDWEALHNPWHFQTGGKTGFNDIFKLLPGHFLMFAEKGLSIKKYWDIEPQERILNVGEAVDALQELLEDTVRLQMIADVPVGAFLSGGLDSSCIVSFMSQLTDFPVRTFTIKFTERDQKFEAMPDDSLYALKVANMFGCDHQEIIVEPDIANLLPKMIWHVDEPLADPAAINTYLISKAAREAGVIVLLNGMGGDEVFGGYRKYLACLMAEYYQKYLPSPFRELIDSVFYCLPVANSKGGFKTLRWAKRFISFASYPQPLRFLLSDQSIPPDLYKKLFLGSESRPYFDLSNVKAHLKFLKKGDLSYLTRMCLNDTKIFLPDHNLVYSDKATMAASVEGRPPLIDHRIVEFMFGLQPHYRINGKTQKYLLKKAMEKYLPESIIHRPKAPFGAPLRAWIRGPLREMIDDLLNPGSVRNRGLYNSDTVWDLIQRDRKGKEDNAHMIWTILSREIWFRTFIDKKPI